MMTFTGIPFLFIFLPVTLIIYYLVPSGIKNPVLLVASLLFYVLAAPFYQLLLIIASVILNYLLGLLLYRYADSVRSGRPVLVLGIIVNLGILFFFKYLGFFLGLFGISVSGPVGVFALYLPVGISIYTLQAISYLMDIYRGDAHVQNNIIRLGVYITMFPRIFNGPIVQYNEIEAQLGKRTVDRKKFITGSWIFVIGLAKQAILAAGMYLIYEDVNEKISLGQAGPGVVWVGAAAFMLYIYFWLSGFSNMAMGMGRMLGFKFPANFNYPFTAKSITDFWKRWTVTLVNWMNRYFRPVFGGRRIPIPKDILSILIIWALIGFWNGPSVNLIVWGLYFALILILEKYVWGKALSKLPVLGHIYSLFLILMGWVIYFNNTLSGAGQYLALMFGRGEYREKLRDLLWMLSSDWLLFVIAVICSTVIPLGLLAAAGRLKKGKYVVKAMEAALFILIVVCITQNTGLYTTFRAVAGSREENGVILGKGGQLFKDTAEPDEDTAADNADGINAFAKAHSDINTYILLVPDASEILKYRLPAFAPAADEGDAFSKTESALSDNVIWLDGRTAIENADADRLYYKTDSHWTTEAAYSVFLNVAEEMDIYNAAATSYQMSLAAADLNGNLAAASGFYPNKNESLYVFLPDDLTSYLVKYDGIDTKISSVYDTSYLDGGYAYDLFFGGDHSLIEIETAADSARVLLIVGDSFDRCFAPFLIPHFGEIVMVNPDLYTGSPESLVAGYGVTDMLILTGAETFFTDENIAILFQ